MSSIFTRPALLLFLSLWLPVDSVAGSDYRLEHDETAGTLKLLDGEFEVLTYSYRDARVRRPHYASVRAGGGTPVTRHWPPRPGKDPVDHDTIHPGIWLAFGDVNGVDFWRGQGEIRHLRFLEPPRVTPDRLTFVEESAFLDGEKTLLVQRARHEIHRRPHGLLLLLDVQFRAEERVDFGDQQEMGLGIRLATPLRVKGGNGRIIDSEGRRNEKEGWGRQAAWCDYSGVIDGRRTGALLVPDPRNFRKSRFHSRDYGFTAANPFGDHDFGRGPERHTIIGTGKQLRLRFGLRVYSLPEPEPVDASRMAHEVLEALGAHRRPLGKAWKRHTIDAGSRGADGIRAGDIDGDGRLDLTTGWEEGGQVRVYFHPEVARIREPWPHVIVGRVRSPEDAVFLDVNRDGILDVVSSCEGRVRTVHVHLAPGEREALRDASRWETRAFPVTRDRTSWMFALPLETDGRPGLELVLGAKGRGAAVGVLEAPSGSVRPEDWTWRPLMEAGWIMSLRSRDVDGDGDEDILLSDRIRTGSGIWWLENPGLAAGPGAPWKKQAVGGLGQEIMFLDTGDLDRDGREDVVAAVKDGDIVIARRRDSRAPAWSPETIALPVGIGTGKGVAVGDLDLDGQPDLVLSCEQARKTSGVIWFRQAARNRWEPREISGPDEGVKFDRLELMDLDRDGDLDVLTCEEADGLGVIWYENPSR